MTDVATRRLSVPGQTYVVAVGGASAWVLLLPSQAAWATLLLLTLPLSLLAMWVGFYAGLAVGLWTGTGHEQMSVPVGLAWVAVWTATAWINARLLEKLLERGWDALRVSSRADDRADDWD